MGAALPPEWNSTDYDHGDQAGAPDFESVCLAAQKALSALNSDEGLAGSEMRDLRRKFAAYEEGR